MLSIASLLQFLSKEIKMSELYIYGACEDLAGFAFLPFLNICFKWNIRRKIADSCNSFYKDGVAMVIEVTLNVKPNKWLRLGVFIT